MILEETNMPDMSSEEAHRAGGARGKGVSRTYWKGSHDPDHLLTLLHISAPT